MSELTIRKVNTNDLTTIAKIEEFLWNEPLDYRISKLNWKLKDLNNSKLGAVAFLNNELIGYRGIMFKIVKLNGQKFKLLHFTDAVVHEKARGMSLLKKMNDFILDEYKNEFDFSYIYFPNNVSGHIYRSQGHKDFHFVQFFRRCMVIPISISSTKFKTIIDIDQIETILSNYQINKENYHLVIDSDFIKWKQAEPEKKYIFCVSEDDKSIFTWIELKKYSIEIQMINFEKLDDCLKLAKSIARKYNKLIVNLPVIEFQDTKFREVFLKNRFHKWEFMNKFRSNTSSIRPILSKKLNDNLSPESIELFNNQTLWEYHNITFV